MRRPGSGWARVVPAGVLAAWLGAWAWPAWAQGTPSRLSQLRARLGETVRALAQNRQKLSDLRWQTQRSLAQLSVLTQKEGRARDAFLAAVRKERLAQAKSRFMQRELVQAERSVRRWDARVVAVLRADQILAANPLGPLASMLGSATLLDALTVQAQWSRVGTWTVKVLQKAGQAELRAARLARQAREAAQRAAQARAGAQEAWAQLRQAHDQVQAQVAQLTATQARVAQLVSFLSARAQGLRQALWQLEMAARANSGHAPLPQGALWQLVQAVAMAYRVPADLVWAVVMTESGGNPHAVSAAGAEGLMQLMPGTAAALGVRDPFRPLDNLRGGVSYLARLIRTFHGNVALALAAYNAGPASIRGGRLPPGEEAYVRAVLSHLPSSSR